MEVVCENCHAKLNIPDDKIPQGQKVRIGCPKCKEKITIDNRGHASEEGPTETAEAKSERAGSKPAETEADENYSYDDYSDDQALDYFEEGTKLSLILDNDAERLEKIRTAVKELGYNIVASKDTRDATGKMRFHPFDLIVLTDGFDGQDLAQSPILNHLNRMSMSQRRRIFLALIGAEFKTMDNMMAFAKSANLVINIKEVDQLSSILHRAVTDNEKFYKVFMDTLSEAGKA